MLPIAILGGGALVASGLGYLWYDHKHKSPLPLNVKPPPHPPILAVPATPSNPTPLPHPANASPDAPMAPPAPNPLKTAAGHTLVVLTPLAPSGAPTQAAVVSTAGPAVGAAHDLYDAILAHGYLNAGPLITAFQVTANGDPKSVQLHGLIPVTGKFDLPTSAALTIYTGLPVPPDPSIAPVYSPIKTPEQAVANPDDMTTPGPGAMAASNLYAYLKLHPNVNKSGKQFKKTDAVLFDLVKGFQVAVNHDPKFPGPAYAIPAAAIIKKPLSEDGQYGKGTSDALAAVSFERINP